MAAYLIRRIVLAGATVLAATFLTYVLLRLVPGEPAQVILTRIFIQDQTAAVSGADVARIAERFGLDAPILVQYGRWLLAALRGDLGNSIRSGRPVLTELGWRLSATALLAALATFTSLALTLALVALKRRAQGRKTGAAVEAIAIGAIALPSFYLGVLLIILFAVRLDWLPVSGFESWAHLVLPVAVLALGQFGFNAILLDGALDEAYAAPHIDTARAKGLSESAIFTTHALPNALVPLVPYLALQFAFLIGGVVVVERLFSIPGLGAYLTDALDGHDGPAFLGAIAVIALTVALANLIADLVVARIDPRIRLARTGS
ncbi:peptide/nickel transport system permease protein [Bosea sp. CRIB-10]|jgi:ABC-type dipeptide/oligopeptide/nickel transport system permease component|uniref:ABC transporter permease n=1 Tax=Bosea sp. CRIB-10 TaxID=378404 RepID=UPI0008E53365|nr:ABC transporter permease [Bosea sp. CRIB-10]SFD31265.1 peptide/nickel transport system permease protein [Bosea sp. CRIB-10]